MARRTKRQAGQPAPPPPEFRVNPFADLRPASVLPPKPPAPLPVPKPPPAPPPPALDPEDQELLEAFKDAGSIEFHLRAAGVRLSLSRRRGGRCVTRVLGLPELGLLEQMRLTGEVRTRFDLAARFVEAALEVDGDQRERLLPWLRALGYPLAEEP